MIRQTATLLNYYKYNIIFPSVFGYLIYADWSYTQKYKKELKAKKQN